MRASRSEEAALLRSASSRSMASATRRRASSSIEHTVEYYQFDGAPVRASGVPSGVSPEHSYPQFNDVFLWIKIVDYLPLISGQVFLPHSRWITFSLFSRAYLWLSQPFPQTCPQGAHNLLGVSAHVIHSAVHLAGWYQLPGAGRMAEPPGATCQQLSGARECQTRELEQLYVAMEARVRAGLARTGTRRGRSVG
jgi:hypothetical protein